jgi:hypothetical protein
MCWPVAKDVAQTFAERRRRVEGLISSAEFCELALEGGKSGDAVQEDIVLANNYRLRAICEHLGLRAPTQLPSVEPEGEDPGRDDVE